MGPQRYKMGDIRDKNQVVIGEALLEGVGMSEETLKKK